MKKLFSVILLALPTLLLGQGNLDLQISRYAYCPNKDTCIYEDELPENEIGGYYDSLEVRTNGFVSTFTFHVKEEVIKEYNKPQTEEYKYLVVDYYEDEEVEIWALERLDGAGLTFMHIYLLGTYTLSIPEKESTEAYYQYRFTKIK